MRKHNFLRKVLEIVGCPHAAEHFGITHDGYVSLDADKLTHVRFRDRNSQSLQMFSYTGNGDVVLQCSGEHNKRIWLPIFTAFLLSVLAGMPASRAMLIESKSFWTTCGGVSVISGKCCLPESIRSHAFELASNRSARRSTEFTKLGSNSDVVFLLDSPPVRLVFRIVARMRRLHCFARYFMH